jgi:hypothetical protein
MLDWEESLVNLTSFKLFRNTCWLEGGATLRIAYLQVCGFRISRIPANAKEANGHAS